MKAFLLNFFGILAIAPWVYMLLAAPMAYFFFDVNIWAPVFQRMASPDHTEHVFFIVPILICSAVWTWFFVGVADIFL